MTKRQQILRGVALACVSLITISACVPIRESDLNAIICNDDAGECPDETANVVVIEE